MSTRQGSRRLFVAAEQPRVRRAGDGVAAGFSFALLVVFGAVSVPSSGFDKVLARLFALPPGWFDFLWKLFVIALIAWPAVLAIACVAARRWAELRDIIASAVVASAISMAANRAVSGSWESGLVLFGADPVQSFPVVTVGLAVAVVAVARPSLTLPLRRFGRWIIAGGVLGTLLLGSTLPVGAVIGLLVGQLAAALVHIVLGTQDGVPSRADAIETVAALGVTVTDLEPARRQDAGVYVFDGTDDTGRDATIRMYGRDARDTQALAAVWRGLWYRGADPPNLGRSHRAEHEAFVTLRLADRGLAVPEVSAAGGPDNGDAALVLSGRGTSFTDLEPDRIGPDEIRQCWNLLGEVHAAGLAIGDLGRSTFMLREDGRDALAPGTETRSATVMLDQLVGATSTPSEADLRIDEARMLILSGVLLAERTGPAAPDDSANEDSANEDSATVDGASDGGASDDGAAGDGAADESATDLAQDHPVLDIAIASLGRARMESLVGYLQPAALSPELRAELHTAGRKVSKVRTELAEALEVEDPETVKLRRVSLASVVRVGVIAAIAYFLISALTQVNISQVIDEFAGANWFWLLGALLLGQFAIASQAVVTQGASPRHVAYGPLVLLQFAVAFIMLAVPSSAARIAMEVRFFQRQSVPASAAVSISLLDSFAGFLVQVALLILTLVVGVGGVHLDFSGSPRSGSASDLVPVLVGIAVVLVVVAAVMLIVSRLRRWVVKRVRGPIVEMWDTARGVRTPMRVAQLFGGNLMAQILYGMCLGATVLAFGQSTGGLAGMVVVYIVAALFGGFMPVPGGVGVMEAAIAAGLTALGIDSSAALSAALAFRAITFYLPPIWGAGATGWLRRQGDL